MGQEVVSRWALIPIHGAPRRGGQITPLRSPPYFILIDRALRDEGTSYHYVPAARYSEADPNLLDVAHRALADVDVALVRGSTWTTAATRPADSRTASRNGDWLASRS